MVKAAWKGHDDALRWLLTDPEGPALTAQLHTLDLDSLSAAQLARNNGNESTADWLEGLAREDLHQKNGAVHSVTDGAVVECEVRESR